MNVSVGAEEEDYDGKRCSWKPAGSRGKAFANQPDDLKFICSAYMVERQNQHLKVVI